MPPNFFKSNRTHVIELYSHSNKFTEADEHEVLSGTDAGSILSEIFAQSVRFVYVPNPEKFSRLLNEAQKRNYKQLLINLYEPENVQYLRVNPGDSILINGQGDIENELIAGYEAEELVDILDNDLDLKKIPLKNLDIDSCMMGRVESYRDELKSTLKNFQTITTYTDVCSVSKNNNVPCRLWIAEHKDKYVFYTESELNTRGTRIIEYTDTYKNLLDSASQLLPNNQEISTCLLRI